MSFYRQITAWQAFYTRIHSSGFNELTKTENQNNTDYFKFVLFVYFSCNLSNINKQHVYPLAKKTVKLPTK